MPRKDSKKEIQKRTRTIKATYQEYIVELNKLKKKQSEIIDEFIKELEQRKIEEIKKALK